MFGIMVVFGIFVEFGILLIYWGVVNSVRFLIGYLRKGGDDLLYVVEWVVDLDFILVIYMGLVIFLGLVVKFMVNGFLVDMLVVVVEWGMIV